MRATARAIVRGVAGLAVVVVVPWIGGCAGVESTPAPSASPVPSKAEGATPAALARAPGSGYARGSREATVVVTEFSDFGCHYCAHFARTVLPTLDREFIGPGRVRWQLVPVATASTPHALAAAGAAECASQQGGEWAMHDRLFATQREWTHFGDPTRHFVDLARADGLDVARFVACLRDPRTAETVERLHQLARQLNVRVAPTFFVNGRRVEGAVPLDAARSVLDVALSSQ